MFSLDRGGPDSFVIAGTAGISSLNLLCVQYLHAAVIPAGAILGITAALLWAAQGTVVMVGSYTIVRPRIRLLMMRSQS
jgi:hypothetical protein